MSSRLRKKSVAHLILGGAALQRCGDWLVLTTGFSHRGQTAAWKALFPQLGELPINCGAGALARVARASLNGCLVEGDICGIL